jgi:hypothetical protein
MSDWKIVVPETTNNRVLNPSAEVALNFTAEAGTTVTRETTYSKYGVYSYRVQCNADNEGMTLTLATLAAADHYVSMVVRGTLPAAWDWSLNNVAYAAPAVIEVLDANWTVYGLQVAAANCAGTLLYIHQNGAGAGDFYVDGVQVEAKTGWTTYCDGDQPGCSWDNAPHASTSTRSAYSRAGGRVYDLDTQYGLKMGSVSGEGMGPIANLLDSYAIIPGGEMQGYKTQSRPFTMTGLIQGTSFANLHAKRQALLNVLKPDAVPDDQPIIFRYTGATVHKQISAYYEGGLEYAVDARDCTWENVALRFLAADPYWYEIGQSAAVLDSYDTATLRYIAARFMTTGLWSATGLAANPITGGTINAICIASDKSVWIGGDFTGWGNVHGRDYVARYIPGTGWAHVGADHDVNGIVYAIAEGPDGKIYVGGAFTDVAAIPNADYVAVWDGAAWGVVGNPNSGGAAFTSVRCLEFDHSGNLYMGGTFTDVQGVALAHCLARWDGANWTAVGDIVTATTTLVCVYAISIDSRDYIAIGGNFTNLVGDGDADYWATCNGYGAVWTAINDIALNGVVYAMNHSHDDILYVGGAFTNAAGIANADYILGYRGWEGHVPFALSTGADDTVYSIHIAEDGLIWVGGDFVVIGGMAARHFAIWNGSSWVLPDLYWGAGSAVNAIDTGVPDPVIDQNYDVWVANDSTGAEQMAGSVTITNDGTENAYPVLKIERVLEAVYKGGPLATLYQIRNETTGKTLHFNYPLLGGEVLTVDTTPSRKKVWSSFFGRRASAILPSSDLGTFCLQPGTNVITAYVWCAAGPVISVTATWADSYWSLD